MQQLLFLKDRSPAAGCCRLSQQRWVAAVDGLTVLGSGQQDSGLIECTAR